MQTFSKVENEALTKYQLPLSTRFIRVGETGFIIGSDGIQQLKGALYLDILSHCSSTPNSSLELIELLRERHADTYIWHATTMLEQHGYLESSIKSDPDKYIPFDSLKIASPLVWSSCAQHEIPVVTFVDDLDSDKARLQYDRARQQNRNWLPVVWTGPTPSIGPVLMSNGPCLECLNFRLRENRSFINWLKNQLKPGEKLNSDWLPYEKLMVYKKKLQDFAASWTMNGTLQHTLVSLLPEQHPVPHIVMQRPECGNCGDPFLFSKTMQAPILLFADKPQGDHTIGFRSQSPEDTWNKLAHHVSPVTGIVNPIRPMEGTDCSLFPVYKSGFAISPTETISEWNAFNMPVFGKGRTAIASQVSALCEGIERASARFRGDEPIHTGSIKEMGSLAIAPHFIQHFSKEQFQHPARTLALGAVPKSIGDDEEMDWLPAWSLRFNEKKFIPADAVLLHRPIATDKRVAIFESNGLSAGNTLEEAILQGLLEVIERDAVAIWWFNRLKRPAFKLDFIKEDDWFRATLLNLNKEKWEVFFLDLTLDTHIPVVAAIGKTKDGWLYGFGCHFNGQLAASRALTELVQVRAIMKPVSPPEDVWDVAHMYPHTDAKERTANSFYPPSENSSATLIQHAVQRLANIGADTIVINCTRPDINVPVAKVIVPGFRAFRPRFAPGRLFDVPVELGLIQEPTKTSDLTPFWLTI